MKGKAKNHFINFIFPAFVFGFEAGVLTGLAVSAYKLLAKHVIEFSHTWYGFVRENLFFIPLALIALFALSFLIAFIYKKDGNLKGGGIPTSIGILRGLITFKWLRNLIGTFLLSLTNFLTGVPLGNEGPSVQIGTAIGRGSVKSMLKKHRAWDRYSMTGGACAGFATATGATVAGVMFAIEEAHQRISPMIIIVSGVAVLFSRITAELLCPILGVSVSLFPEMELLTLSIKDIWIPLVLGIAVGFFAVLFLKYYKAVNGLFNKALKKVPHAYKIFIIYALTLTLGLISFSFISTGHELILSLFENSPGLLMLALILLVRATLTLGANANSLTGGIFLPILALGAVFSSFVGGGLSEIFSLGAEYYPILLVLGITACISGMMKMPLTAIVFAIEALSCHGNVLYVITASAVAFAVTEMFGVKSINDSVLERKIERISEGKEIKVIDTFLTVKEGAFAEGKQIRDIFWPANLFVLSVKKDESRRAEVDEHGGREITSGDVLHVRYSTYDDETTKSELVAIVGEQDYKEKEIKEI